MKKYMIIWMIIFCIGLTFHLVPADGSEDDKSLIRATALNYLEGWFEGNVKRMDKALHEKLIKRIFKKNSETGDKQFSEVNKAIMLEYTKKGSGKKHQREKLGIEVEILDIFSNIATVKTKCFQFIDYLHLVKTKGEWKIVSVLWQITGT